MLVESLEQSHFYGFCVMQVFVRYVRIMQGSSVAGIHRCIDERELIQF